MNDIIEIAAPEVFAFQPFNMMLIAAVVGIVTVAVVVVVEKRDRKREAQRELMLARLKS